MSGYGVMDFMVRTYRNNKALLKKRKSLKKIYEENNLHYIRKKAQERAAEFDPERRRVFLEKFYARQKRIQKRLTILLAFTIILFSIIVYSLLSMIL